MANGSDTSQEGSPLVRASRFKLWLLAITTAVSFLLVVQNYVFEVLPSRYVDIPTDQIRPYSTASTFAYVYPFDGSEPDQWPSARSRVNLFEDDHRYSLRTHQIAEVTETGGDRFMHEPGRIVFAASDNTDPRTNGRKYSLETPILYCRSVGVSAMLVFLASGAAWYFLARRPVAPPQVTPASASRWRWHLLGAMALFILGLYFNTGTLAPYGNTCAPMVVPKDTGYVYNQDHPHYRVLYDFVDGKERSVWDRSIMLRRILFPVLGWPLMHALGFELGGTLTSLAISSGVLVACLVLIRRRVGEGGAIFAAWTLALYPGAAYWAAMPYSYALIFPGSLLLMLGLWRLTETTSGWRLAGISLGMGVIYLGYDLGVFFVPATLVALCWRRRPFSAVASAVIQLVPQACWVFAITKFLGQPLLNGNSGIYRSILDSYAHPSDWARWLHALAQIPDVGFDIFFAANFLFLPALFLLALAANAFTSRVRFTVAETSLLASALGLFLFLNLAPSQEGTWQMGGTWISRIYQPVFPVLVLFLARWWGGLPALSRPWRALVAFALAGAALGNALIIFGPILNNPLSVSEAAFYRFYDHTDAHFIYENTLKYLGRRPLGFPRPQIEAPPAPTAEETRAQQQNIVAEEQATLRNLRRAVLDNAAVLAANQKGYREAGRALAEARCVMYTIRLQMRLRRGEITADQARLQAKTWQDFEWPELRALLDAPPAAAPDAASGEPEPSDRPGLEAALKEASANLVALVHSIGQIQGDLSRTQSDLAQAVAELKKLEESQAAQK